MAQMVMVLIVVIDLCYVSYKHGKPPRNYNFWYSLIEHILVYGLLLWWGGFWDCWLK